MKPRDALVELLLRLGDEAGGLVRVRTAELKGWPPEAVADLKLRGLLSKARPATSAICPGCELACTLPVQTATADTGRSSCFLVCDRRDDINRIPIAPDQLSQWSCRIEAVCDFVAEALSIRRAGSRKDENGLCLIGVAIGKKHRQLLAIRTEDRLCLVAGGRAEPLTEFVDFREGRFALTEDLVCDLVDSAAMANDRHTPSTARREVRKLETEELHESWRAERRRLERLHPGKSKIWISRKIAKSSLGREKSPETIRRQMG